MVPPKMCFWSWNRSEIELFFRTKLQRAFWGFPYFPESFLVNFLLPGTTRPGQPDPFGPLGHFAKSRSTRCENSRSGGSSRTRLAGGWPSGLGSLPYGTVDESFGFDGQVKYIAANKKCDNSSKIVELSAKLSSS